MIEVLPCLDSDDLAAARKQELDVPRNLAAALGRSATEAARRGYYLNRSGERVDWSELVEAASAAKISIAPDAPLPDYDAAANQNTRVQVANETTLLAAHRLAQNNLKPLALNFANGVNPGGGFLHGSRAQEEVLCRSSALYATIAGDPMYEYHRQRPQPDSTDWAIYSPHVPVFRTDSGEELDEPWLLSFLTCAAPYAPGVGQPQSGDLLRQRMHRVLAIAQAYGHDSLVLGAWGCGAFRNDPQRTAADFRSVLENDFGGAFTEVVFAVTDWSPERKFLGPFRDAFAA